MKNKGFTFGTGFKTIVALLIVGFFGWLYVQSEYFPADAKTSGIQEREEATFLNLNESVILELNDKQKYNKIEDVAEDEKGKEKLFEELDKSNYSF